MNIKQQQQIRQYAQMAGFVLIVVVVLGALHPITLALTMMHPQSASIVSMGFTPDHMGLTYKEVSFEAADGVSLAGWLIEPQGEANGAAVIVSHAYGNNRVLGMWHAFTLAQAGYTVLVYDHRAHGDSGGAISGSGWSEDRDVLGAVVYLQSRGEIWIGAAGLSLGAVASVHAAAQTSDIQAVWADGLGGITVGDNLPPCNLKEAVSTPGWMLFYTAHHLMTGLPRPTPMLETLRAIAPRPTMLVIAGQSELEVCNTQRWAAKVDQVQTWVIETGHISGMETHRDEYQRRLVAFFDAALNGSESE